MTSPNIKNCFIFISDAFRFDYLPESLRERGVEFKTIAASIDTPTATTSIVSGLNPLKHGVYSFNHRIPQDAPSLLDIDGYDSSFFNAAGPEDALNDVLRQSSLVNFTEVEPPFIHIERDHGGHHPYNGAGYNKDIEIFREEFSGDNEKIREAYGDAIEASVERFSERLDILEQRGILDETLVIFTSDHGELLGENGLVGHLTPVAPEVVNVPTVFIHPSLKSDSTPQFIGHVDLFSTILSKLGEDVPEDVDGVDVFDNPSIDKRFNYAIKLAHHNSRRVCYYKASSVWDDGGGYIFNETRMHQALLGILYFLLGDKWMCRHLRQHPSQIPHVVKRFFEKERTCSSPAFSIENAREYVQTIAKGEYEPEREDLESDVENRLKQLGYR